MCLAQEPQRSDASELEPAVSSQALYHWATVLPRTTCTILKDGSMEKFV